jgi:hypothetical protein
MFDYCYWPEGIEVELNKQLDNFHHQAQLLIDGEVFLALANKILKAQVAGKYFELIILLPKGYRTLENANLFHRITQAGAKVGIIEVTAFDEGFEQFSIFDNRLYYSNKRLEGEVDFADFFYKKHQDFEGLMNVSRMVNSYSQEIKLSFTAEKYFATKGEEISFFWESTNANSNILIPGNRMLEAHGEERITIEEDTFLTITSKNEKSKTSLSIFIKCLEVDHLRLSVSIFNKEVDDYVPIESISKNNEIFAVYMSDVVKIEWVCKPGTTLFESRLGKLNNIGFHNFVCLEKSSLNFEMHFLNTVASKEFHFFPLSKDNSNLEDEEFHDIAQKMQKDRVEEGEQLSEKETFLSKVFSLFSLKK